MKTVRVNFTTDGSGNATAFGSAEVGKLYAVQLIDGDLADGVDVTLTAEHSDFSMPLLVAADWNSDKVVYPRVLQNLNTDGTALTTHTMPIIYGRIKVVIAQGGDTKTGAVVLYLE